MGTKKKYTSCAVDWRSSLEKKSCCRSMDKTNKKNLSRDDLPHDTIERTMKRYVIIVPFPVDRELNRETSRQMRVEKKKQ
jgi:hypothetical protein